MPDLCDLAPFHSGQAKNSYLLVIAYYRTSINKVNAILYFIFIINYYELTRPCCMENSVDPDQLVSKEGS